MGTFILNANTQYLHQWGNYDNPLITGTRRVWGKPAWQTSLAYENRSSRPKKKLKIFKWVVISAWVKEGDKWEEKLESTFYRLLSCLCCLLPNGPFWQKHRIHFTDFIEVPQFPSSSSSPALRLLGVQEHGEAQGGCTKLTLAESQPLAVTTSSNWFLHSKLTAGSRHRAVPTGVRH